MPACVPTREDHPEDHPHTDNTPHSPPPGLPDALPSVLPLGLPPGRRRFRIAGADFSASISVFLIALPLSLGIALATGAPLQAGLVAAAVGGIVAGRFGGSPLQVSGPAAGLTVVTADLIHQYGWRTTCAITVLAGLTQLALASLRVARSALAVSPAIVHGMLAGIGVTIALAQLHIVLGGNPQSSTIANVRGLPAQLANLHPAAVSVSVLTIALLLAWPRIPGRTGRVARKIPAALAAVAGATAVAAFTGLSLTRVDLPSWSSHVLPESPDGPVLGLIAGVLTVTLVGSVESLLSAVAVDKLVAARKEPRIQIPRARLDRELAGQGAANVVSGALGGLPITGVAVRSAANVAAGGVSRHATMLHGLWIAIAALLLVSVLDLIPLAALAALVMVIGVQMVNATHMRNVRRNRELLIYVATLVGVVLTGVLEGVAIGIALAVGVALHRLTRTRITVKELDGIHQLHARGQLTFLAVPRLSRLLHQMPQGSDCVVELDGSFIDHAAYEALHDWQVAHMAQGGTVEFTGASGTRVAEPAEAETQSHSCCRPWTPWRNHHCGELHESEPDPAPEHEHAHLQTPGHAQVQAPERHLPDASLAPTAPTGADAPAARTGAPTNGDHPTTDSGHRQGQQRKQGQQKQRHRTAAGSSGRQLVSGLSSFQRNTAPLVRDELARLAREGQRPSQLFLTCSDSRLVTSMITASGPGDLFTVRNVGNLVPLPGAEGAGGQDDSVGAAIEYAVDVLRVDSITVCGHSGCGAMQALMNTPAARTPDAAHSTPAPSSPLSRWLRHGQPSLERMKHRHHPWARISGRLPADAVEQLCLTNVVQQLEHLRAHESVARRLSEGTLELHGMYFHVGEAQAYLLAPDEETGDADEVFTRVAPVLAQARA